MLEVTNLCAGYGPVLAIRDINIRVGESGLVCLLGPNGAGKTTTLSTLAGLLRPASGTVQFQGRPVHGLPAETMVRFGVALVPEGREVLATLSVLENLELGAYVRRDREIQADLERVYTLFPILHERRQMQAGNLSGGQQQMLAIGRALMARPKLLLLDEPSLGLAPLVVEQVFQVLADLGKQGLPMLLVEQNTQKALAVADYAYVLKNGAVVHEGPAAGLRRDPQLVRHFLA